jgi:hypothetical protein
MSGDVERLREIAEQAVDPCVTSSVVVSAFWEETNGAAIDPQAGYEAVREQVVEVRKGGLSGAEAILVGQATALNVIFAEMARRGQAALDRPGQAAERYLRLAMRAQAHCRAALRELRNLADRPSKAAEVQTPIRVIKRIIVRPGDDVSTIHAGRREAEWGDDWAARNAEREAYGEGLDGGATRGLCADDGGAESVGAFDRTPYA